MTTATITQRDAIREATVALGVLPDQIDRVTVTPIRGLPDYRWRVFVSVHGAPDVSGWLRVDGTPELTVVDDSDPFGL